GKLGADQAGQPVVRVQTVEPARWAERIDPRRERVDVREQVGGLERPTWTGRNAVDPHSGDVVDQCRGVIDGPGEDLDLDPDPGQGAGELEHVDVHATGIAPTRARKR